MGFASMCHQIYFKSTGYSYTHLGRLFLRMFIGIMLAQFGVRQLAYPGIDISAEGIQYVSYDLHTWLIITVELICSFCIMIGFLTRLMILPPFILMICSAYKCWETYMSVGTQISFDILCIPFMFMGVYMFLLVVGPGKISVDYFYSLYLINRQKGSEEDLEVV